jgi:hypothetical protein
MSAVPYIFLIALISTIPVADQRPLALSEVDDSARYLFEYARDAKWMQANGQLDTLQRAVGDLPIGLRPADVAAALRNRIRELPDDVSRHERIRTMEAANAITESVIGLSAAFQSPVPAQVPRLAYLGRQIEVGIAAGRKAAIARAVAEIRQTWDELRPELEGRGHRADVRRMTDIVVSLETTKETAEDAALARDELATVSHLEAELKVAPPRSGE